VANNIFQILSGFFGRYGYAVVFFGVMLENLGVPIPGETVLLFAGFLAFQGKMHLALAIVVAITGATAGACAGYALGWYGGPPIVDRLLKRLPRIRKRYDDSQKVMVKHGRWAVFIARFITGLRVFAGLLAGVLRMPFRVFLLFSFAGAVCWSIAIGYVGFIFGSNWSRLVAFVGRVDRIVLLILLGVAVGWMLLRYCRRQPSS
jgi:membrane protein DedA with SNARE-associated domain